MPSGVLSDDVHDAAVAVGATLGFLWSGQKLTPTIQSVTMRRRFPNSLTRALFTGDQRGIYIREHGLWRVGGLVMARRFL